MDDNISEPKAPIVKYGVENKNLPGDETGWFLKDCGNICHWGDEDRFREFPAFPDDYTKIRDSPTIKRIESFFADVVSKGVDLLRIHGTVFEENDNEVIIDQGLEGLSMRTIQLKDVSCFEKESYEKAQRATRLEEVSAARMNDIEPKQGQEVESFLMAQTISRGEQPPMGRFRPTPEQPMGAEKRTEWYREMRTDASRSFWVGTSRQERDAMRDAASHPPPELEPILDQIKREDRTRSCDYFWQYQRDEAAVKKPSLYTRYDQDVVLFLDKNSEIIACRFGRLFQFLFGELRMKKTYDAMRKWASLPPLPIPDTKRHAVDAFIRQSHPELDLEKAQSVKELEERSQCVVHYGTWAMKGHANPRYVFLTPDTQLQRGLSRKVMMNFVNPLMPTFRGKVLGIGSEVARFLFSSLAPAEYQECCNVFEQLPETCRMKMSGPEFATLTVLGINSFTGRHHDKTDVKFGFASLVALGDYKGGDLCFPQLAARVPYKPGDCVIFRGAEIEHFVSDWTGYRVFLLYTNHQPVRNYVYRKIGKLPPKLSDPWHPEQMKRAEADEPVILPPPSESDVDAYDPCYTEPLSPEPERLYEADIHGAGYISTKRMLDSSGNSATASSSSKGRLIDPGPGPSPTKKRRLVTGDEYVEEGDE